MYSLCLKPFSLILSPQALLKSLSPSFLSPPFGYRQAALSSPRSLPFSICTAPALSLSSQKSCSIRGVIFVALLWMLSNSLCLSCTEDSTSAGSAPGEASQHRAEGQQHLPDLLAVLLWMQPRVQLAVWAVRAHCCIVPSFHPPVTPGLFWQGCTQSFHPPACIHGIIESPRLEKTHRITQSNHPPITNGSH